MRLKFLASKVILLFDIRLFLWLLTIAGIGHDNRTNNPQTLQVHRFESHSKFDINLFTDVRETFFGLH